MAQASSAQREPSMEEILASIRRIIEDNETGRQEDGARAAESGNAGADVESFRELKASAANAQPQPADVPVSDAHLGDARQDDEAVQGEAAQPDTAAAPTAGESAGSEADSEPSGRGEAFSFEAAPVHGRSRGAAETPHPRTSAPSVDSPPERQSRASVPPSVQAEPETGARPPMLSEDSGRKVAAAFGELSEAFETTRRKNLTEAAEEMLRPMLQEWLDNNLPQLVEKLVREEIERIARG